MKIKEYVEKEGEEKNPFRTQFIWIIFCGAPKRYLVHTNCNSCSCCHCVYVIYKKLCLTLRTAWALKHDSSKIFMCRTMSHAKIRDLWFCSPRWDVTQIINSKVHSLSPKGCG